MERMGEYYDEKPFKIHAKRKKHKYSEISNVIRKAMKMLQEKNRQRHKQSQLNQLKQKQQLFTRSKKKNFANKKCWKTIQNCCYRESLTLILKKF